MAERTQEHLMSRGLVPAAPFKELVNRWDKGAFQGRISLEEKTGLSTDIITDLRNGKRKSLNFSNAEAILFALGEDWNSSDELYEIYCNFDFTNLDRSRPCARMAA